MITARGLAYQILLNMDRKPAHPDRLLRSFLGRHGLEDRDRALLTELVYGVLRWQGRLDWYIGQLSKIPRSKISPEVQILLRLALYQLVMLDRIPAHAVVDESVKIAKATQPRYVVGFVNALLREASRRGESWDYPDPAAIELRLAVMTSHPPWFIRKMISELGPENAGLFLEANNEVPSTSLRTNTLKANVDEVVYRLVSDDVQYERSLFVPQAVRVSGLRRDLSKDPLYLEGMVQVQDEASQLVSLVLDPRPGERILDLCAGFGAKSSQIAALMNNTGEIMAVDNAPWKLEELAGNAVRLGASIIATMTADLLDLSPAQLGTFDRVLLDAPCTGSGTIRRNPDIKWRLHPKDPYRMGLIQKAMLDKAARFVKKGGALVYSTCSVFPEEDEQVANSLIESSREWQLESATATLPASCSTMADEFWFRSWPHRHGMDGFFVARWRKVE